MQTHIQKWGNSLGIRIPRAVSHQLHLNSGSIVNMEVEDGRLVICSPHYNLKEMLTKIDTHNIHPQLIDDTQENI